LHNFDATLLHEGSSLTIQSSCSPGEGSHGHDFTPLWAYLQRLTIQQLDVLQAEFRQLDAAAQQLLVAQAVPQFPRLRVVTPAPTPAPAPTSTPSFIGTGYEDVELRSTFVDIEIDDSALYVLLHGFRFFVDPVFFAFFAQKFIGVFDPMKFMSGVRPVLDEVATKAFLTTLVPKRIKGMVLGRHTDNTPHCVVCIRSPLRFAALTTTEGKVGNHSANTGDCWYQLHVHWDGKQHKPVSTDGSSSSSDCSSSTTGTAVIDFPGKITHLKLYYADGSDAKANSPFPGGISWDSEVETGEKEKKPLTLAASTIQQTTQQTGHPVAEAEKYLHGWQQHEECIRGVLSSWALTTDAEQKRFTNPVQWKAKNVAGGGRTQLGTVEVRERSRALAMNRLEVRLSND
jgi:hypothetical protein